MTFEAALVRRILVTLAVALGVASTSATAIAQNVPDCSEGSIRAAAPGDAGAYLDRAFDWIHRGVPYCQCVSGAGGSYRTDCSGFVSMVWNLPAPGHTTYSFAGGPWDDHVSTVIGMDQLTIGDALNYPGSPSAGTGHIVLFGGWLNAAHSEFCSLEESHTGTPARVITRWVDPAYLPIRAASRMACHPHCEGSVIVGGDCGRGDCAAYGAGCTSDALGTRCVYSACPAIGDADVCLDSHRISHCHNGLPSAPGDCSVYGSGCVQDALGARCVFSACPAVGDTSVCLDDHQIVHCHNGAIDPPGDCSVYAAMCSMAGASNARCVSAFCVADAHTAPVEHDGCWIAGGDMLHCDANGAPTRVACPSGQQCTVSGGAPHCATAVCPPTGEADVCASATEIGHCYGGSVSHVSDCTTQGGVCSTAGGTPHCASMACVEGTAAPQAHDTCLPTGWIGHCDATGMLQPAHACPADQTCVADAAGARCATTPVVDAGVTDASGADGSRGDARVDGGGPHGTSMGGCAVAPSRMPSRSRGLVAFVLLVGLALSRRVRRAD